MKDINAIFILMHTIVIEASILDNLRYYIESEEILNIVKILISKGNEEMESKIEQLKQNMDSASQNNIQSSLFSTKPSNAPSSLFGSKPETKNKEQTPNNSNSFYLIIFIRRIIWIRRRTICTERRTISAKQRIIRTKQRTIRTKRRTIQ